MNRYVLSPRTASDLNNIWDHTQTQWGAAQAENYIRDIQRAIEGAVADPRRGRPCDHVRPGYFKLSAGSHVIFYRLRGDELDVVRILHQRMDFDRHL
ncbi:type II toxin-antitoxin system RelE/ParE family toxin [Phenylobacterium sp. Root700]|uniref:type II toxin-antitoxin system RelE/ParE family toxin n=1 Tax=Phenylobacterium sp. Root700 TaxID=1736591 RepID=UPI0006FCFC27|nr:type II toxin-antitoxin system RelE/ParE family toxin [Phenylobacterium sp. Root700]KRB42927.1 plasmid stabilization protein ParE [Phenylobacterium sp. Root700]